MIFSRLCPRHYLLGLLSLVLAVMSLGQACAPPDPQLDPDPDPQTRTLPAESARVAFASQCAQNVIQCTTSFPTPIVSIVALPGQTVTRTANGYRVQGSDGNGLEPVQLVGSESLIGRTATVLHYSWSYGAQDTDPRTLTPGVEFAREPDPEILLEEGLHYLRLTVTNDSVEPRLESPQYGLLGENVFKSDFLEIEVEVRD